MKNLIIILITLFTTSFLQAKQDPWLGNEYAKNSVSQKASADDFLQGMQFQGFESHLPTF